MAVSHATANASRVALVFGGSRGIGAAAVQRLAADGFDVAFTYVSRADSAAKVTENAKGHGGRVLAIRADSANPDAIESAVAQTVAQLGPLNALVVNAGVIGRGPIGSVPVQELDRMLNINVRGVFLSIQAAVPHLAADARVVTIGSNVSIRTGTVGAGVYQLTKTALIGLVKGAALDLADRRITVNNIQPGPTDTDMKAGALDALAANSPLKRVGSADEIAALISFLTSPESGYMTGTTVTIDGGYTL
ncbi:SDR family oxidoreductase [Streptomyces sp. HYC2]|uniref:SDR family NAD(P)-dependent oxidoreductase n=1 Tax=Streptomyces sp. HYC2 TaxID=2955207 RepID=UPI00248075B6|nr:SDR family oxidoreductase [Streptomyces sp. HYC2]